MIELKNIYKEYRNGNVVTPVLKEINLNIDDGEFVAIIGASGSGKTTLLNIIGLMDKCTTGEYFFNDRNMTLLNENERSKIRGREISFVFQNFGLIENNTVKESVEMPLLNRKISRNEINNRIRKVLESVDLADYEKRRINQLSGGQKQRVAIARAIVCGADIILCDEPTGSLDSDSANEIMKIIKELNNNGTTVILISHDMNIAREAKRIIEIKDGRIIKDEKNC